MSEEIGIKDTLEALDFAIPFANKIDETTKDGFKIIEAAEFIPVLTKLPAAISGGQNIPKELGDLNDIERQQVIDKVKELEFTDEDAEIVAEKALNFLVSLGELLNAVADANK